MPTLTGIFQIFADLDKIPVEDINRWLKNKVPPRRLLNFVGNRIQYPQAISQSAEDLEIDLAILREAVRRQSSFVYNPLSNKIILPKQLVDRFPPILKLVSAISQALNLKEVTQIFLKDQNGEAILGSIIVPNLNFINGSIKIYLGNFSKTLTAGTLTQLPIATPTINLKIDKEKDVLAFGGRLGVLIDLRKKI